MNVLRPERLWPLTQNAVNMLALLLVSLRACSLLTHAPPFHTLGAEIARRSCAMHFWDAGRGGDHVVGHIILFIGLLYHLLTLGEEAVDLHLGQFLLATAGLLEAAIVRDARDRPPDGPNLRRLHVEPPAPGRD